MTGQCDALSLRHSPDGVLRSSTVITGVTPARARPKPVTRAARGRVPPPPTHQLTPNAGFLCPCGTAYCSGSQPFEGQGIGVTYPAVRIDKLHPDGSPRASWYGYRLPDRDGAARVFRPGGARKIHVHGLWTPVESEVSAFHPDWGFAVHRFAIGDASHLYIDVIRSVQVRRGSIEYVDLYLDVMVGPDGVREKDEELLVRLADDEVARVRRTRDEIRRLIATGFSALQRDGPFWEVPIDAQALPPRMRRRSRAWPRA